MEHGGEDNLKIYTFNPTHSQTMPTGQSALGKYIKLAHVI